MTEQTPIVIVGTGLSGYSLVREFRKLDKETPVIMVTAKGEESDRVQGFETGADDYVVKPFSTRELLLRIRALLRRKQDSNNQAKRLEVGPLEIDPEAYQALVDGEDVALTILEFRLLHTLVQRRGRVQTRDVLLEDVWEYQAGVNSRTVDTHVKRLREKLASAGPWIETVRGVGYRFRAQTETIE